MKKLIYLAIAAFITMQSCKNNPESAAGNPGSEAVEVDSSGTSETATAASASGSTDIKGIVWKELEKLPLDSDPSKEESIGIAILQPGAPAEQHSHTENEIGYVLEGEALLEVEGQPTRTIRAGDSFAIPAGKIHRAKPGGSVPFKVVVTYIVKKGQPLAHPSN